ncbi:MAG: DUF4296 domain-containing protein [Bacteroidota bacterium]
MIRPFIHISFGILGILALMACQPKEKPYLTEKKMQRVLLDLHMADVITEAHGNSLPWRKAMRQEHYDEILDIYSLSREDFFRSYDHYLNNPEIMDSIYVRLIKDIELRMEAAREKNYDSKKDKEKWIKKEPTDSGNKEKKEKKVEAAIQAAEKNRAVGGGK